MMVLVMAVMVLVMVVVEDTEGWIMRGVSECESIPRREEVRLVWVDP